MFLPFSTTYHKEFLVGDIGSWREINNETPEILEIVRRSWELQRNDGIGMEIRRNHGVYKYMNWILCEKRNCKEIGMRRKEGCCNWYDTSSSKFTSLRNLSLYCVPRVFRKFPEDLVFFFFIRFLAYDMEACSWSDRSNFQVWLQLGIFRIHPVNKFLYKNTP